MFKLRSVITITLLLYLSCTVIGFTEWNGGKGRGRVEPDVWTLERQRREAAAAAPVTTEAPTTPTPAPSKTDDANRTANTTKLMNTTLAVTQIPLLGVNGSGILKVNLTEKTPTVSEPISPDSDPLSEEHVIDETPEKIKAEHNLSSLIYDNHTFYNSTFIGNETYFDEHWKNITKGTPNIHTVLSSSHRRATNVALSFAFPFYGQKIRSVTVATGGFIYTGEQVHSWLAATQYIAPLMANFDTRMTNDSVIRINDDGEKFTVFWDNVTLQENPTLKFTFAVTLYKNGDIDFSYKEIPMKIDDISEKVHPVKVGISDAYITDKIVFYVRRKTIYEYHRASFKHYEVTNKTILRLTALPTCMQYDTCNACLNHQTEFNCTWCAQVQKCSSGTDKNKQDWSLRNCEKLAVVNDSYCPKGEEDTIKVTDTTYLTNVLGEDVMSAFDPPKTEAPPTPKPSPTKTQQVASSPEPMHTGIGGVVAAFVAIAFVASIAGWVVYAFRNPHTPSGQLLIKYRPTQWNWRRGEARYTAATIHM